MAFLARLKACTPWPWSVGMGRRPHPNAHATSSPCIHLAKRAQQHNLLRHVHGRGRAQRSPHLFLNLHQLGYQLQGLHLHARIRPHGPDSLAWAYSMLAGGACAEDEGPMSAELWGKRQGLCHHACMGVCATQRAWNAGMCGSCFLYQHHTCLASCAHRSPRIDMGLVACMSPSQAAQETSSPPHPPVSLSTTHLVRFEGPLLGPC